MLSLFRNRERLNTMVWGAIPNLLDLTFIYTVYTHTWSRLLGLWLFLWESAVSSPHNNTNDIISPALQKLADLPMNLVVVTNLQGASLPTTPLCNWSIHTPTHVERTHSRTYTFSLSPTHTLPTLLFLSLDALSCVISQSWRGMEHSQSLSQFYVHKTK